MLRFINTDTLAVQEKADFANAIERLELKFGLTYKVSVQFTNNDGAVAALSGSPSGKFYLKESGKFDASVVAAAESWTITGSGDSTLYTFTIDMNTEELAALLASNGNPSDDVPQVDVMGAFYWDDGTAKESLTFTVRVFNNVVKGTEGSPTPAMTTVYIGEFARLVSTSTGAKLQTTSDGGTTWNDSQTWP